MTVVVCRRCFVSGRVQGVYFRASTAKRARRLGITGYARNLADGRVEVFACGADGAIQELCDWLWEGPPAAQVTDVSVEIATCSELPGEFSQR